MKRAAVTVIASMVWTACSVAGPPPTATVEAGPTFSLRPGESKQVGGALRVGFEGVTADSRCPKGEQCIWAGDATARIWLQQGNGPRQTRELHTATGPTQAASALDHDVRLMRLDPYPTAGRAVAKDDYVATLTLSRGAPAEAVR